MAYEADRVVVELLAKVDQFDQPVKQSATNFNKSMDQITASATKAEAAVVRSSTGRANALQRESAQISQFTRTLASDMVGVGDLMLSDRSPFVAPVKQAPAVNAAVKGVGLAVGAMGGIMETVAGVGVALLIAKIIELATASKGANSELDEMVQKLKENHDKAILAEQAHRVYATTVEGSIDKANEFSEAIGKQNKTLEDNIELLTAQGAAALKNIYANVATTSAKLAQSLQAVRDAQADVNRFQGAAGDPNVSPDIAAAYSDALARFGAAKQQAEGLAIQLVQLSKAGEGAGRALREVDFPLIERNAKNAVNPIGAINQKYDDMAAKAKKAGTYTQELANSIERMREADLRLQQQSRSSGSSEFGRRVSFTGAADIAHAAGLTVTSAYRSTADQARLFNDPSVNRPGNPVARPGTSAHEGVNGKWALDIAFAPGLTAQSLKKLYGDEGVSLSAVYKEAGHFHIEGSRTQAEISADRDASRADAARQRALDAMSRKLADQMGKEEEIGVIKEHQVNLAEQYTREHGNLLDIIQSGILPSLKDWEREYDQIKASQQEVNYFGERLIDDVLNPDNWRSWGSIGKTILRDLESEFIRLAAINPLKNLLFGQNNPTLSSVFSLFGGGGGMSAGNASFFGDFFDLGFASGGSVRGGGSSTSDSIPAMLSAGEYVVNAAAVKRIGVGSLDALNEGRIGMFAEGGLVRSISPSNARASAAFGGMSPATVRVLIEASKYFDGQVLEVAGPVIAQSSVAAANGGATISRRNLSRESQHRLE
jgi:hypothetical protein